MVERAPSASFIVEHDDPAMGLRKLFTLSYWEEDGTLQMYDTHLKRTFLKRTVPPERPKLGDFYIGALIVVCARPLRVLDYGDDLTRRRYASVRGTACMLVKPDAYHAAGKIVTMIYDAKLHIGRLRMLRLSEAEAADFLSLAPAGAAVAGRGSAGGVVPPETAVAHLSCDVVLALEVTGDDVMARLHELAGPADPAEAKELAPVSIRAIFGKDRTKNAIHVSRDGDVAKLELAFAFDRKVPHPGVYTHCAVCLIKPHAIADKAVGKVLDAVLEAGLEVSAARSIVLAAADAVDYLEAYRSVCPEYERWVVELSSGPAVVLEVRGEAVVDRLRELAGPYDPEIARALRPATLRARFGVNAVKNAVHVTDIDVDGPLESKFFFVVLE